MLLLSGKSTFEFKNLFDLIFASLRARNATGGGEEMLRLRVYEKLQNLVSQGVVKKTITEARKTYKGKTGPLLDLSARMRLLREEWDARAARASAE